MKMKALLFTLACGAAMAYAGNLELNGFAITLPGTQVTVSLDGKILAITPPPGDIKRNSDETIKSAGGATIKRDSDGEFKSIGGETIKRNSDGKVRDVGGAMIKYDDDGKIRSVGTNEDYGIRPSFKVVEE